MIRTEIKDFFVDLDGIEAVGVTLPASLYQALGRNVSGKARLYTKIHADDVIPDGEHLYLKVKDLRHSATISFNGSVIGMPTSEEPIYSYDITDRLTAGDNLLEITFEGDDISTAGIFGGVEIVKFANRMIDTVTVEASRDGNEARVSIRLATLGSNEAVRAVATLVSGSGQIYYAGLTKGRGSIVVKDPLFWWPRGVGIQNLYKLTVNLYGESEIEDTVEMRIGFAHLTTDGGVPEVNGEPFTPLGAVYCAPSVKTPSEELEAIGVYVGSLAAAGVNTLVIPEGAPRICDRLYDLCDLYGIVTVHEISAVTSLIRARLFYQGYRPSVGMIDLFSAGDDIESVTESLRAICHKTDVNYHEKKNEYSSLYALPSEKTVFELVREGERNPFSPALDCIREDMLEIIVRASEELPYAPDLASLAYLSRLSSARETERRLLLERIASRRAVFDDVRDESGLLSSGILDSRYRRTALYYYLARGFSDTHLYAVCNGGVVDFYAVRSGRSDANVTVDMRIVDRDGEAVFMQSVEITVPKTSAARIFSRDFTDKIIGRENELYLEYILRDETGILSNRKQLFCEIRKYKFAKPRIKAEIAGSDKRFSLMLSSDALAMGVEVSFEEEGIFLSDNYFDLSRGEKHKLIVTARNTTTPEMLLDSMRIRTVNELIFK